jgi:hypothetical protein
LHPTGIEGANQTIFVRRIALRPPIGYFDDPEFDYSFSEPVTVLERFRATLSNIKHHSWVVEKPEDTQSLPAEASGSSGSADFEELTPSPSSSEFHGSQSSYLYPYPGSTRPYYLPGFFVPFAKQKPDEE